MHALRSMVCFLAAMAAAAPALAQQNQVASPMRWGTGTKVLVLGGGSSHNFQVSFNATDLATLRELKGPYALNYTESVDVAVAELPKVDVFITSTNQSAFPGAPMRQALFEFIDAGKSAILIHPAVWYNFPDWAEYNQTLVGGGSKGHDMFREFEVKVDQPDHPIMRGVPASFRITDELYWVSIDSAGTPVEVLATGINPEDAAKTYPSVWVVKHPKARIVGLALGHDEKAHQHPAFKTVLKNSLEWVTANHKGHH